MIHRRIFIGALAFLLIGFVNTASFHFGPSRIPHCEKYQDKDHCSKCEEGYRTSLDKKYCFANGNSCDFVHCEYCQVTVDYNDLGCSVCNPEYEIVSDANLSGVCQLKNPIEHCAGSQESRGLFNNAPNCYQCDEGYAISNDGTSCFLPDDDFVPVKHCYSYIETDNVISCNYCDSEYTLTLENTCEKGCDIDNCDDCAYIANAAGAPTLVCYYCKKGFIGVFDTISDTYSACMTSEEWQDAFVEQYRDL